MSGTRPPAGGREPLSADLRRILSDLRRSRLDAGEWAEVAEALDRVDPPGSSAEAGDTGATTRLSNLAFQGRVRRRLARDRVEAPAVAPTKSTPALPLVGAVCAVLLLALGWAIGGIVVLTATALLALFVLGVAVAGTHTVTNRRRSSAPADPSTVSPPPPAVAARLDRLIRSDGPTAPGPADSGDEPPDSRTGL